MLRGKGTLYARGGVHPVQPGQAFIILPGEVTTYRADSEEPWHYRWIGFDGELSHRFAQLPPVVTLPEMLFGRIMRLSAQLSTAEYLLAGELFALYAHLFAGERGVSGHVRRVEDYIRSNYMKPIRVEAIAGELNLDRRYLSRLFKQETGVSIQERLIRIRMEEAEHLLLRGYCVKEAALLSGYEDASSFSRTFKKYMGRTPVSLVEK